MADPPTVVSDLPGFVFRVASEADVKRRPVKVHGHPAARQPRVPS